MSNKWAIRLSLHDLHRAGEIRSWAGVDAAVDGETLWLRGDGLDPPMQRALAPIADGPVFQCATDGRLTPFGNAVPSERLPNLDWKRLADFLQPVLPAAQMTSVQLPRVPLSLERSSHVQQEALLVTDWDSFSKWVVAAPEIRLHACRFAVSRPSEIRGHSSVDLCPAAEIQNSNPEDIQRNVQSAAGHLILRSSDGRETAGNSSNTMASARVVIQGIPLPPLEGERYWLAGRVAVPLGYHWAPSVDIATLEKAIRHAMTGDRGPQTLWLWNKTDHTIDVIEGSDLIPLTRTNVRATEKS